MRRSWIPGNALPHIKNGTVRALGVTSLKRNPLTPDWPAISETLPGLRLPDLDRDGRTAGHVARNGEQDPRRDGQRAQAEGRRGQAGRRSGPCPFFIKPEDLKALIDADTAKWIKIAKDENLQAE